MPTAGVGALIVQPHVKQDLTNGESKTAFVSWHRSAKRG
jgi:hypothetical protein